MAKGVLRALLLLVMLGACSAPNRFAEKHLVLVESNKELWRFLSPAGVSLLERPRPRGATLESVAPNLDSVVFNQLEGDARSGYQALIIKIRSGSNGPQQINRVDLSSGDSEPAEERRYRWLARDGTSLLANFDGVLVLISRDKEGLSRRELRRDVLAVSGLGETVAYLSRSSADHLQWCSLAREEALSCSSVPLGKEFAGVEVLKADSAILYQKEGAALRDFHFLNRNTARLQRLDPPQEGLVLDFLPVPYSTKAFLLLWRGEERFDGTRQSEIVLWDWKSRKSCRVGSLGPSQRMFLG